MRQSVRRLTYNSSSPSSKFAIFRFSACEIWRVFSIKNLVYCFVCPGLILQNWNQVEIQYSYAMTADSDFLFDKSLLCPAYVIRYALVSGLIMHNFLYVNVLVHARLQCSNILYALIMAQAHMYIYTLTAIKYNSYH